MAERPNISLANTILTDRNFDRLSELIHSTWGIKMPPAKKVMLQGRLSKRLRRLGMKDIDDYCRYLFSPDGQQNELLHVIDVVSTNKTEFFREINAFEHLVQKALPRLIGDKGAGVRQRLMLWSAGCSTGEEPYTLAMCLDEFSGQYPGLNLDYLILATDISMTALETGRRGVYPHVRIEPVPMALRLKYLMKSKDKKRDLIRVRPRLRSKVRFRQMNLMEDFGMREPMDIIFCRNVIIYFDRQTQEKLFDRFCRQLRPNGYIYIGHSESLHAMSLPLEQEAPNVYRKVAKCGPVGGKRI